MVIRDRPADGSPAAATEPLFGDSGEYLSSNASSKSWVPLLAGAIAILACFAFLMKGNSTVRSQPGTSAFRKPIAASPLNAPKPTPENPAVKRPANESKKTLATKQESPPEQNTTPTKSANSLRKEYAKRELARLAALEKAGKTNFSQLKIWYTKLVQSHGDTPAGKEAAARLKSLKPSPHAPTPASMATAYGRNYALATNSVVASGGRRPNLLIDGNATHYTGNTGFA